MKTRLLFAASTLVLASFAAPAFAQPMNMPSMATPAKKAAKKPLEPLKRAVQKAHRKATPKASRSIAPPRAKGTSIVRPTTRQGAAAARATGEGAMPTEMPMPAPGGAPGDGGMEQMQPGTMPMGTGSRPGSGGSMTMPSGAGPMRMGQAAHAMSMTGVLGPYAGQRESSGTAWQPDSSAEMGGPMMMSGNWMLMAHGTVNLVADHQSGPRGGDKMFASGMLMGMARHPLGDGTIQFRAMLSPDPAMGPAGYPLLLATGETANGRTPLVDRQHPHDLFMELSASVSQDIGQKSSVFLYAGLPGEPAFGPPAFMHRESILDSPEAPISHHWLDSTHITFGVVTAGLVMDRFKVEASRFNAREPDQHRWNIETGPLDSSSIRLSWNPTRTLALQASWGHFVDPEQLEPGVDQTRWSASALWARDVLPGWHAAATLAWGRKSSEGHDDDAYAAEASVRHSGWTLFGRGELIENRELLGLTGPAFRVGKVSLGAIRDFRVADHLSIGAGGLFSLNFVPDALASVYGSRNPTGAMGFVRVKLD